MAQPDLILVPFAANAPSANVDAIPISLGPSDPPQAASWSQGFPQVTMTPLAAGGIPPRGQSFNGVLQDITQHLVYIGGGGQYRWSQAYVTANGGYPLGAVIQSDSGLLSYVSLINNNTQNFNTNPASIGTAWRLVYGFVGATETTQGVIALATQAQVNSGTVDNVAITPLKLFNWVKNATRTLAGFVRLSTPEEVTAGTNDSSVITPLTLKSKAQSSPIDGSPGVFLTPGAFGLGGFSTQFPGNDLNNTAINYNSTWGTSTGCLNAPPGFNVQGSIVKVDSWLTSGVIQQTFLEHITGRTARRAYGGSWSAWVTLLTSSDIPSSSETVPGIIQIATTAEVNTGTNDTKAVTPLKMAARVNSAISGALNSTLGYGKTYTDFTSARSSGVSYTNNAGAPILVIISLDTVSGAETTTVVVGGVTLYSGDPGVGAQRAPITFAVPNGASYSVTVSASTIQRWVELR